jgi:YHS domain-containing protein
MKALRIVVAVLLGAGFAWAFQGKPVNDMCPVKTGEAAKPGITTTFNGKTVAFCCNNCKNTFEADPQRFASKVGPQPRTALNSISDAIAAAKDGPKPAMILFMDAGAKSKSWSEMLGDKELDETFAKVSYAAVLFEKGSDEAKKYSVTTAPVLVLIDPTENKSLKTITSPAVKTIKTEVENAVKKLTKK